MSQVNSIKMAATQSVTIHDETKHGLAASNTRLLNNNILPPNNHHNNIPPYSHQNSRTCRHYSVGRQLSRTLSRRAKMIQSASPCNITACIIGVCFVISVLALGLSLLNFYWTLHGMNSRLSSLSSSDSEMEGQIHPPINTEDTPNENDAMDLTPRPMSMRRPAGSQAYAHVVGVDDGDGFSDEDLDNRLSVWKNNITHNVHFRATQGVLKIEVAGLYYVYSQIYFSNSEDSARQVTRTGENIPMLFITRLRRNRESTTLMSSVIPFEQFSTKYHGGIFNLEVGDEIDVSVPNAKLRINTRSENTFFGMFMVTQSTHT